MDGSAGSAEPPSHWGRATCRRRRRLQATAHGAALWGVKALSQAAQAVVGAAGAVGSGWALLSVARALLRVQEAERGGRRLGAAAEVDADKAAQLQQQGEIGDGPIPKHIAVIMDGNRRYGRSEHGDSLSGHRAGGEKLQEFIEWCSELGAKFLTVFAFSTENWKRPLEEVDAMMCLFVQEVPRLGKHAMRLNCRVRFLTSDAGLLPDELRKAVADLEELTAGNTGLQFNVCLSYGGRSDVACACRQLAKEVRDGELQPEDIDEGLLSRHLLTGEAPEPDVLIRTSGEKRLSNFLVFQLAYTELFFLDKHWPEVTQEDLLEVVRKFGARGRRFGK